MHTASIRQLPTKRSDLFAFEVSGRIHSPDIEAMAKVIEAAFASFDKIDMLILITVWDGIDAGAVFDREALSVQARASKHVRKYAVVGAPGWAEAMINLFSPFTPVEEKTFDLNQQDEAWAWIDGDPSIEEAKRRAGERP